MEVTAAGRPRLCEMMATPSVLDAYLGKPMGEICCHAPARDLPHHRGAQFIGHVLRFEFGRDHGCSACQPQTGTGDAPAMCVERLFHRTPRKGLWVRRPPELSPCLIFIAPATHVRCLGPNWMMACSPRNEVGIYWDGRIWTYQNDRARVVNEAESEFLARYCQAPYTRHRAVELLYGEIPD